MEVLKKALAAILAVVITLSSASALTTGAKEKLIGDVNFDKTTNVADATIVQQICADMIVPTKEQKAAADADGNGIININDATHIQMIAAAMLPETIDEPDPTEPLTPEQIQAKGNAAVADFGMTLLSKSVNDDSNTLISPVSIMYALAVAANGADGETLSQMEKALGLPIGALNEYFKNYTENVAENPDEEVLTNCFGEPEYISRKLSIANSVWYKDSDGTVPVKEQFLTTASDVYGADIKPSAFDSSTVGEINKWVDQKTDGMIKKLFEDDSISPETLMCLVNAVCFDADWEEQYDKNNNFKASFTRDNGTTDTAEFMKHEEYNYLSDNDGAEGFVKDYFGEEFAFAAFMPKKGVKLNDYLASLSGEKLQSMLSGVSNKYLSVSLPKFKLEYGTSLNSTLQDMGIKDAFDPGKADFSNMCSSKTYIGSAIHKTFIELNERGTRAAAATAITMEATSLLDPPIPYYLTFDRPFVYVIYHKGTNTPLFIGTMENLANMT